MKVVNGLVVCMTVATDLSVTCVPALHYPNRLLSITKFLKNLCIFLSFPMTLAPPRDGGPPQTNLRPIWKWPLGLFDVLWPPFFMPSTKWELSAPQGCLA